MCIDIRQPLFSKGKKHNPSKKNTWLGKFFDFLFHMDRLYFRQDNTAKCSECGVFISVPMSFCHPFLKIFYFLLSSGLCYVWLLILELFRGHENAGLLVACTLLCIPACLSILARIITSLIFAAGSWNIVPVGEKFIQQQCNEASIHRRDKLHAMFLGTYVTGNGYIVGGEAFQIYTLLFAIICIIVSLIHKQKHTAITGGFCILYASIMLLSRYFWMRNPLKALDAIIPFMLIVLLLYSMFNIRWCIAQQHKANK